MARHRSAILAIAMAVGLLLGACANDDPAVSSDEGDASGGAETAALTVGLSMDGIDIPDEIEGGIVEVTLETELEYGDLTFSKVAGGTSEETFRQDIVKVLGGGPFPEYMEAVAGIAGEDGTAVTLTLPEGEYIVWSIPEEPEGEGEGEAPPSTDVAGEDEGGEGEGGEGEGGPGGPPPEAVRTKAVTVTAGEAGDLPDPGDQVTAVDYSFDVKIQEGAEEILFRNEGPNQYHHAIFFNFGDIEASVVEANIMAFLSAEGPEDLPEVLKVDEENIEVGSTGVFSPTLGGTGPVKIESGNTYAVACFISDKTGGPPHAIANKMYKVFAT